MSKIGEDKKIHISALANGTSIDHIPRGKAKKLIEVLGLEGKGVITVALNVESKKLGRKDLFFLENRELTEQELNKVKLIARNATLNIIKNYEVIKKERLGLPEKVEEIIKCINPNCITNFEKIPTKFLINPKPLQAKCFYCETVMNEEEIMRNIK
jgi:aspartate carbamoyltransferase regulatory subunit